MNNKYYLLFFYVCSVNFACLKAQTCPVSSLSGEIHNVIAAIAESSH